MEYTKGEWKAHKNALGTWTISTDLEHIGQIDRHFNAHRIVMAVNCHDDLYEALRAAQTYVARKEMYSGVQDRTGLEVKIIKALSKAEVKDV